MFVRAFSLSILVLIPAAFASDPSSDRDAIAGYCLPLQANGVALAPDGRHAAYAYRHRGRLSVAIVEIDHPGKRILVPVEDAPWPVSTDAPPTPLWGGPPPYLALTFIRWSTSERLVYATNYYSIWAVNADGKQRRELANPALLADQPPATGNADPAFLPARRPTIVACPPDSPDSLVVAALAPPSIGLYRINVLTGKFESVYRDLSARILAVDQQGRPRLARLPARRDTTIPIGYAEANSSGRERSWTDLDSYLGTAASAPIRLNPKNYWGIRSIPLGFDYDPDVLYLARNAAHHTFGIYGWNLRTQQPTGVAWEEPAFDLAAPKDLFSSSALVFDRYRQKLVGFRVTGLTPGVHWLDAQLRAVQARLDAQFPDRTVLISDWNQTRSRCVVFVTASGDPGRYYLYDPATDRLEFLVRCAPWLPAKELNSTAAFSFEGPGGTRLSGYLTMPRHPRTSPPALLVYCHDGLGQRDQPDFNPQVQALAAMGLAVLQVNYRGSTGFGRDFFEAGRTDVGNAPANDVLAAVDWAVSRGAIDRKRIALIGHEFGGYVALRCLQIRPEIFRSAVVIDPATDLGRWSRDFDLSARSQNARSQRTAAVQAQMGRIQAGTFGNDIRSVQTEQRAEVEAAVSDAAATAEDFAYQIHLAYFGSDPRRLNSLSPALHPEAIKQPVFVIRNRYSTAVAPAQTAALWAALARQSSPRADLEIDDQFDRGYPAAQVEVFAQIEEFLNVTLYDYGTRIGGLKIIR